MTTTNANMLMNSTDSHNVIPFNVHKHTPNAETKAALAEYEEMKRNPSAYKRYDSFDDVLSEVFSDA